MIGPIDFNGNGPANSCVELFDENDEIIAKGMCDDDGRWTFHDIVLPHGEHIITARMSTDDDDDVLSDSLTIEVEPSEPQIVVAAQQDSEAVWLSEMEMQRELQAIANEIAEFAEQGRQKFIAEVNRDRNN